MLWTPHGWRVRSRSRHLAVDYSTNIMALKEAQAAARDYLDARQAKPLQIVTDKTLDDVVKVYRILPKKAGAAAEKIACYALAGVVRLVTGKELSQVSAGQVNAKFWLSYIAKRQGFTVAKLGQRAPQNAAINSAMRNAAAVFKPSLRPLYAEHGVTFPDDVTTLQLLPVIKGRKPAAKVDELTKAWAALPQGSAMWWAIGLARFAGLRRAEIMHASASWVETDGAATFVRIRDRPEEGYLNKTGEDYRAVVIDQALALALRSAPPGLLVPPPNEPSQGRPKTRKEWMEHRPQAWCRPFVGGVSKPLHRLRGLYADDLAKLTADAVQGRLAGERAAADALGHTSTATTRNHYLTDALR